MLNTVTCLIQEKKPNQFVIFWIIFIETWKILLITLANWAEKWAKCQICKENLVYYGVI